MHQSTPLSWHTLDDAGRLPCTYTLIYSNINNTDVIDDDDDDDDDYDDDAENDDDLIYSI